MSDEKLEIETTDTVVEETPEPQVNPLNMPDEEINDLMLAELGKAIDTAPEPVEEEEDTSSDESNKEASIYEDSASETDTQTDPDDKSPATDGKDETPSIDYKAEYERLTAPFKANGKQINVANVDDAIKLMQMGANYGKKMNALKPGLKQLKLLENNGLLNDDSLAYLIDLHNKDPKATAKFIKDSGIDPVDIDLEQEIDYTPNKQTVSDSDIEIDNVLNDIRGTPTFNETIDVISNKWDDKSKQILYESPSIISIINEHIGNGIYAKINDVVENERMLGRLTEMSDIQAYEYVGKAIQANGGFTTNKPKEANVDTKPVETKKVDPKLSNKKKAASSTKGAAVQKTETNFNPLAMSDDEFSKMDGMQYL